MFMLLVVVGACTKVDTPPDSTTDTGNNTGNNTGTNNTSNASFFPALTGNFQTDMLGYVNALRTKGCKCDGVQMPLVAAVKWNTLLENASKRHGNDMSKNNFFNHTGSDGSDIAKRANDAGYMWSALGENIAKGYASVPSVIDGWVKSSGHCKNMMSANFTELGAANVATYWVQDFGKSR